MSGSLCTVMDRRGFLTSVGAGTIIGIAGCTQAPEGEGEETETTTEGETTTEEGTTTGVQVQAPNEVAMVTEGGDYYFDPIGLFVEPGETITFVNEAGAHSSTAYAETLDAASVTRIPDGAEPWNSGILSEEGASFEHTFETTGTYDYFCIPHKALGMVGRIVVDEPSGVEENPPDGEVPSEQDIVDQGAISYSDFTG